MVAVLIAMFILGLLATARVQSNPGTLYVNGAGGNDTAACGTTTAPCKTVTYTLQNRAVASDTIRIAQGTYSETIVIDKSIALMGGYRAADWSCAIDTYETVLDGSANGIQYGDWDSEAVKYPAVLVDEVLKMWYTGIDIYGVERIGFAKSADGTAWSRSAENPVLDVGPAGAWDAGRVESPTVIKDGDEFKMWYTGEDERGNSAIGYATSEDGIEWTKYAGNPVLKGGTTAWNQSGIAHPWVILEGGVYNMWLFGSGPTAGGDQVYMLYAESADGVQWKWSDANPLFTPTWETWFWRPSVVHQGATYQMWYSVLSGGENRIAYATSADGFTWTKQGPPAQLSGIAGNWDEKAVEGPAVLFDASLGGYGLFYGNRTDIGVTLSTDGMNWSNLTRGAPVLERGAPSQYGEPTVKVTNDDAIVTLDGLTITGGGGQEAGGVSAGDAVVTVRDCYIHHNAANGKPDSDAGGGVMAIGSPQFTVEDTLIIDNFVRMGASGVRVRSGTLAMTNTVVANNRGDVGIHLNGPATLMNVTVANNRGGILYNPPTTSQLTVVNSIVYNELSGISKPEESPGAVVVSYSDIQGGWVGTGNIDADPKFVDFALNNLTLGIGSPAIDTGTSAGAPDHDLDHTPRPIDGNLDGVAAVDMGAYEFAPPRVYLPLVSR